MLVEVKVKVSRIVEGKTKKLSETYILNKEFFAQAEYDVQSLITRDVEVGTVDTFEIQSIKISQIKELAYNQQGETTFIATLKDVQLDEKGNEKALRYKVLLWADSLTQADRRAHDLAREGYDMTVEGIKQVDYIYLTEIEETEETNE